MLLEAGANPMDAVDKVRVGFPPESVIFIESAPSVYVHRGVGLSTRTNTLAKLSRGHESVHRRYNPR